MMSIDRLKVAIPLVTPGNVFSAASRAWCQRAPDCGLLKIHASHTVSRQYFYA